MVRIEEVTERELEVVSKASIVADWIRKDKDLTVDEVIEYSKQYPEIFGLVTRMTTDELLVFFSKYREGRLYADFIEVILSPRGREWLNRVWPTVLEARGILRE